MNMNQRNRIALVTGASSGIGQATAELLAKTGYKVYGTSRRGGDASRRSFEMLRLDVSSDESVDAVVQTLMQSEGRIDLVVNSAGFGVVAEVVLKAASAARPRLRYTAGGLASRLRLLRRFASAGLVDAGIRGDLRLDGMLAVKTS